VDNRFVFKLSAEAFSSAFGPLSLSGDPVTYFIPKNVRFSNLNIANIRVKAIGNGISADASTSQRNALEKL
jgi:hypothetical protein